LNSNCANSAIQTKIAVLNLANHAQM